MLWDDEVREAKFSSLGANIRVSAAELAMSVQLVDSYSTQDTFGAETSEESRGAVLDLMEALRRSVAASRTAVVDSRPA